MKYLMVLLLSFIGSVVSAQSQDSIPHKHDMYIHIVTVDSNLTALMSIGHFLTDNRFQIAKIDKDFLSLSTNFFALVDGSFITGLQANVKGNEIKIKILSKSLIVVRPGDVVDGLDMEYKESGMVANKIVWVDVISILSKFPHSRIYYTAN